LDGEEEFKYGNDPGTWGGEPEDQSGGKAKKIRHSKGTLLEVQKESITYSQRKREKREIRFSPGKSWKKLRGHVLTDDPFFKRGKLHGTNWAQHKGKINEGSNNPRQGGQKGLDFNLWWAICEVGEQGLPNGRDICISVGREREKA